MKCPYCKMDFLVKNPKAIYHHTPNNRLTKNKFGWVFILKDENIFIGKNNFEKTYFFVMDNKKYKIAPITISKSFKKNK